MIPITAIIPTHIYSQEDAPLLLGTGFSEDAAREVILEACRSGELESRQWRRRYWFTGRAFLDWVTKWFGPIPTEDDSDKDLAERVASPLPLRHNDATNPEPVAKKLKGGGR
jgi:hypothetical protein